MSTLGLLAESDPLDDGDDADFVSPDFLSPDLLSPDGLSPELWPLDESFLDSDFSEPLDSAFDAASDAARLDDEDVRLSVL